MSQDLQGQAPTAPAASSLVRNATAIQTVATSALVQPKIAEVGMAWKRALPGKPLSVSLASV
jgi:hypothetical protein